MPIVLILLFLLRWLTEDVARKSEKQDRNRAAKALRKGVKKSEEQLRFEREMEFARMMGEEALAELDKGLREGRARRAAETMGGKDGKSSVLLIMQKQLLMLGQRPLAKMTKTAMS